MNEDYGILSLKPEFQQTKIGFYNHEGLVFFKSITHSVDILNKYEINTDQYEFRAETILEELDKADIDLSIINVIIATGGLLKPIASGIYVINEALKYDLRNSPVGRHSANLGGLIADYISGKIPGSQAYIADPAVVDELDDIARFTGLPDIKRKSVFHALNQKFVARQYALSVRKPYEEMNIIVAHLGDGISIGAHKKGKVVDVNQCFDGEGPFSLERTGSLPMIDIIQMCFSGKYSESEILTLIRNHGGLFAYTGTNSYHELGKAERSNNKEMLTIFEAMAYQISKYIGYMAPVFCANVDAILLTGTLANSCWFTSLIQERVRFIAPVNIFPGEDVLDALAMNAILLITGEVEAKEYF